MRKNVLLLLAIAAASVSLVQAQAPVAAAPQAAAPAAAVAGVTAVPAPAQPANPAVLQGLQQAKATNDAILAKQAATLQQLQELEKAADQMRILSTRS